MVRESDFRPYLLEYATKGKIKKGSENFSLPSLSHIGCLLELKQRRLQRLPFSHGCLFALPPIGAVSLQPYCCSLPIEPVFQTLQVLLLVIPQRLPPDIFGYFDLLRTRANLG